MNHPRIGVELGVVGYIILTRVGCDMAKGVVTSAVLKEAPGEGATTTLLCMMPDGAFFKLIWIGFVESVLSELLGPPAN